MNHLAKFLLAGGLLACVAATVGCGSGSSGGKETVPPPPAASYTVSGMVSGAGVSGLKLTLNGGQELTVNSAGPFAFPTPLPNGSSYSVQVSQNPTAPPQACTL